MLVAIGNASLASPSVSSAMALNTMAKCHTEYASYRGTVTINANITLLCPLSDNNLFYDVLIFILISLLFDCLRLSVGDFNNASIHLLLTRYLVNNCFISSRKDAALDKVINDPFEFFYIQLHTAVSFPLGSKFIPTLHICCLPERNDLRLG